MTDDRDESEEWEDAVTEERATNREYKEVDISSQFSHFINCFLIVICLTHIQHGISWNSKISSSYMYTNRFCIQNFIQIRTVF